MLHHMISNLTNWLIHLSIFGRQGKKSSSAVSQTTVAWLK
jgi:hypothetical protein